MSKGIRVEEAASVYGEDTLESRAREWIRGFIEGLLEEELTLALGVKRSGRVGGAGRGFCRDIRDGRDVWTRRFWGCICRGPTRGGSRERCRRCFGELLCRRMRCRGWWGGCRRTSRRGVVGICRERRWSTSFWTAGIRGCGWARGGREFQCWSRWVFARTAAVWFWTFAWRGRRASRAGGRRSAGFRGGAWGGRGRESRAGWREAIVALSERGIGVPKLAVIDGSAGLEKALGEVWPKIAIQRCTAHKLRNLEGKAPVRMREELREDYRRMIYAETAAAVEQARARFIKKWRLACPPVAASLEEAGEELFSFLKFPKSQWKALRTTNALERINEEFRRRTKTQASLPSESAVLLLLFGLLRSGQIRLRAIDGCHEIKAAA